jgi:plastocyanin
MRSKPFAVWVITGGLVLAALVNLATGIQTLIMSGTGGGGFYFLIIFAIILVIPAIFVWREKRWAYVTSAIVSILYLVIVLLFSFSSLLNPADAGFPFDITWISVLLLVIVFGFLAFRFAKTGLLTKKYLATPQSVGGLFTLAVVGFAIGSLVVGAIGAGIILRSTTTVQADIKIVQNAMSAAVPYSPAVFHVVAGRTVTWVNLDTTAHTVTSNVSGQFDSGYITTGQTWSWTFTTAGTYHYYCAIHPSMTGTIIVT